jgi:hypothetical protein
VYLYLAIFWLVLGVMLQYYWDTLARVAFIPISRELVAIFCFVLISYNMLRWRMARAAEKAHWQSNEPPPPKPRREFDPASDLADSKNRKSDPDA